MTDVNPYPIDPEEFYTFLTSQQLDAIVGTACDDGDCPLARFLNEQYPGSQFYVNMTEYRRNMDDISLGVEIDAVFPLPGWAQDFAWLVDNSVAFAGDEPICASDALCFFEVAGQKNGIVEVCHA